MVKKISKLPRTNNFISFENIVGVLLAILIIFDLKLEEPICNLINTNAGKLVSFIIVILLFLYIHPIIGILFLIYLYQCINTTNYTYSEQNKYQVLQQLNPPKTFNVEEEDKEKYVWMNCTEALQSCFYKGNINRKDLSIIRRYLDDNYKYCTKRGKWSIPPLKSDKNLK